MRTTLTIDSDVLSEYKRVAADLPVVHGGVVLPGVDLTSNAAVERLLDEDLPLEKRR